MDLDRAFKVNERDVIAESIDGEVLIINLNSGVYFSADGTGDEIWRCLAAGMSVGHLLDHLSSRYTGDEAQIREQTLAFVTELVTDDLLAEDPEPAAVPSVAANASAPAALVFSQPALHRYTDFEELLRLDPIHEVHEAVGWPVAKPSD